MYLLPNLTAYFENGVTVNQTITVIHTKTKQNIRLNTRDTFDYVIAHST